ncbi:MAG: 1-acyl-sn-glycerol-3-phosphate acyltransferase [Oscillospiraceae bacterium]|nr:1-acyl-sn-glycerol-3-phosphate acyltransferase [Oscillospiraceae bacterium]
MNRRHDLFYRVLRPLVSLFARLIFGYTYETAKDLPENYIVISNHATDYDMLFVAASFPRQMYFVASEHIARWGFLSRLIQYLVDPIFRPKGASAAATVMEMVRKARKGHNVCLFAEGVRTWDGVTCSIVPSTGKLVKTAGCGLVTYKITGGYFASPMWGGASVRKGYLHGAPVNVYTPEQLREMSAAEVQQVIEADLYEDAYARQLAHPKRYRSKNPAKGMENLLYICPKCGAYDCYESRGNGVSCQDCGFTFRFNEYGMLEEAPFETVYEFSQWQKGQLAADVEQGAIYRASCGQLKRLEQQEEFVVTEGAVEMSGEYLRCGEWEVPMSSITDLAMHGQRAIVFTAEKQYYELIPARGANALKFFLYYNLVKESRKTKRTVR